MVGILARVADNKTERSMILEKWKLPIALYTVVAITAVPVSAQEQAPKIDPVAVQLLQEMTDYMVALEQFSVHTQNNYEDELVSGQRVDYDVSANVLISRPDKLYAERTGEQLSQVFYYDGKTLTLSNPNDEVAASEPAPGTIEEMLDYTREELGLYVPIADLVYRNAFVLLTENVSSAIVLGKTDIGGVSCQHLAFSRPDVDFQVWVADTEQPLPCKYVVTDKSTPALISTTSVMSDWDFKPSVSGDSFSFVPGEETVAITFLPLDDNDSGVSK
jgi:hypothetical protein